MKGESVRRTFFWCIPESAFPKEVPKLKGLKSFSITFLLNNGNGDREDCTVSRKCV